MIEEVVEEKQSAYDRVIGSPRDRRQAPGAPYPIATEPGGYSGGVGQAIESLEQEIAQVADLLTRLERRLQPIALPNFTAESEGDAVKAPPTCEAANWLLKQVADVRAIRHGLHSLLDRIDL